MINNSEVHLIFRFASLVGAIGAAVSWGRYYILLEVLVDTRTYLRLNYCMCYKHYKTIIHALNGVAILFSGKF